jgi:putative membrane protein
MRLLLKWILSALALIIVTKIVPGFVVATFGAALIAAIVIGLLNATIGFLLKLITLPLGILTLGIFFLVINALMLLVASHLVPGFVITGFAPAFIGAIVLALLNMLFSLFEPKATKAT